MPEGPTTPPAHEAASDNGWASRYAAAIVLLAYSALVGLALCLSWTADDKVWVRVIYLLSGVEAIAFAAAGLLFGREVSRGQAVAAEARAVVAEDRARELGADAANGQALASAVLRKAPSRGMTVAGIPGGNADGVDELQAIAAGLYPRLAKRLSES